MNARFFAVGSLALLITVSGCGVEGVATPPEDPSSAAKTNSDPPPSPDALPTGKTSDENKASTESASVKVDATTTGATSDKPGADKPASDKPAPDKPASDKPAATAPSDVPGANISIGKLEADGVVATDIQCRSDGGGGFGLLGMVLVTAWMSPHKKALDACAPAGKEAETRVIWKASGGKLTEIEVKGDAKVKACVEKALRPGKPVFEGHCAATVHHGKTK